MKTYKIYLSIIAMLSSLIVSAQTNIPYGDNPLAGKYVLLNGVKHYYEIYGEGKPLLLIHGNSTPIRGWGAQIAYFSKKYKVVAVDSRGRGKTEIGNDSLTFIQMAADMAALLKELKLDSVNVVGKSDGAIVALLMGIHFPDRIDKIVAFSANLWPDSTALYPETVKDIHDERVNAEKMLAQNDTTKNWYVVQQRYRLMEFQPSITAEQLAKIRATVLVMTTDRDVIREEHSLFIYQHIPKAHLAILSVETHHLARQNPDLFNTMIDKFLNATYKAHEYRFKN